MSKFDLHNNCDVQNGLNSQTIATDGVVDGEIIDTKGIRQIEFVLSAGTITDGTYVVTATQGDDPALADGVAVPAELLLGSIEFTLPAESDTAKRIGFIGKQRYVRFSVEASGVSTGGVFDGTVIRACHNNSPVANQ